MLNLVKIIGRISDSLDDPYDPFSRHGFSSRTQLRLLSVLFFRDWGRVSAIKVFTECRYIGLSFEEIEEKGMPLSLKVYVSLYKGYWRSPHGEIDRATTLLNRGWWFDPQSVLFSGIEAGP